MLVASYCAFNLSTVGISTNSYQLAVTDDEYRILVYSQMGLVISVVCLVIIWVLHLIKQTPEQSC